MRKFSTKHFTLWACLGFFSLVSAFSLAEDEDTAKAKKKSADPLKIMKIAYAGPCVKKNSDITLVLNRAINRGINVAAISGPDNTHFHPKVKTWGLRSATIVITLGDTAVISPDRMYHVQLEQRPHKQISNKKPFRTCK